jgi:hypothetical protein
MRSFVDQIHDQTAKVQTIAFRLEKISSALYTIGNIPLAEKLGAMSESLDEAVKEVNGGVGAAVQEMLDQSGRTSATILEGVLAGIEIANEGEERE